MVPWGPGHGIDRGRCDRGAGVADCPLELHAGVRGVRLNPYVRTRTHIATFGRDDKIFRIGVEGFCNEQLTYLWSIGVSSIDQVDTQFKGAAQDCDGFLLVRWWSPDTWAGEAHCTKAQAIDLEVSTNGKHPTRFRRSLGGMLHSRFLLLSHSLLKK